ncbi:hypothetical protein V1503_24255 [Bacillus sp. SCS-151]|uniref:hypothetical protein n=1 Tax=Nanhaiella sioensis TaxID=3115293 RepID=UPI00397D3194
MNPVVGLNVSKGESHVLIRFLTGGYKSIRWAETFGIFESTGSYHSPVVQFLESTCVSSLT